MERILYFDCFSGISGDMTLGALIDLGANAEALQRELGKLALDGYHLHVEKTQRQAISGVNVDVHLHDHGQEHEHDHEDEHTHQHDHCHEDEHTHQHDHCHEDEHIHAHDHCHEDEHIHAHDHCHEDERGHGHTHDHYHEGPQGHKHHHEHARNLYDIQKIIEDSAISSRAKELAISIFTEIAKAEGKVHGKTLDQVHFHEVGAVDSIVDIVGTAICLDLLDIDQIYCSPIHEGHGFIQCQHGRLPVPVPAVTEMLVGSKLSLITGKTEGELVTPTGFGILKATAKSCGPMPTMNVSGVGYGFGKRDTGCLNALRVFLGSPIQGKQAEGSAAEISAANVTDTADGAGVTSPMGAAPETITVIETTMDDETGEILGYTMERLMEGGALDAFYTPVFMKKNRPAVKLTVLCRNEALSQMADIIFAETSTIGLRHYRTERMILARTEERAVTPLGDVRVKTSSFCGGGQKKKPEYSDCIRLAKEHHIPLRKIYEIIAASEGMK